ncbi:MAG: ribonuclease [Pseudomonadota bacterium]|jgi:ribonuclease D
MSDEFKTPIEALKPIWVTENAALAQLCLGWNQQTWLAVDTEFLRTNTYYPIAALLQIYDGSGIYFIDPKTITQWQPLAQVMANPGVCKALHACSEDLEIFALLLGALPVNMFDTQVAAAMVGQGFSVGYARLVEQMLGVRLPKDETRSDWLVRPLSPAQTLYAAWDVYYLLPIARQLQGKLVEQGRLNWLQEDCAALLAHSHEAQDARLSHLRLKGLQRMNRREQALAQVLCHWREGVAQDSNMPRNHVVKESAIYQLAQHKPKHISQLRPIEDLAEKTIRRYGEDIIELIQTVLNQAEEQLPPAQPRPLSGGQQQQIKDLRQWVEQKAQALDVAPEVLARKRDYEYLVRGLPADEPVPSILQGWRQPVLGQALLAFYQNPVSQNPNG